VILKEKN